MQFKDNSQSPMRVKQMQAPEFYDAQGKKRIMDQMNLIVEPMGDVGGIWLGSLEAANDLTQLKRLRISAVLSLCPQDISQSVKQHLSMHQNFYAQDVENFDISQYFDQSFDFIDKARKNTNILIHCHAGISRSTTVLVAYLMRKSGISLKEAMDLVRSKRWHIYPNQGFLQQLSDFEGQLLSKKYSLAKDISAKNNGFKQAKAVKFDIDQVAPKYEIKKVELINQRPQTQQQPQTFEQNYQRPQTQPQPKTLEQNYQRSKIQQEPKRIESNYLRTQTSQEPNRIESNYLRTQTPQEPIRLESYYQRTQTPQEPNRLDQNYQRPQTQQQHIRFEQTYQRPQINQEPKKIDQNYQRPLTQQEPNMVELNYQRSQNYQEPKRYESGYSRPQIQLEPQRVDLGYQRPSEPVKINQLKFKQNQEFEQTMRSQLTSNREYNYVQNVENKMTASSDGFYTSFVSNRSQIEEVRTKKPSSYINNIMSMSMDPETYKTYLRPTQYEEIRKKYLVDDNKRFGQQESVRESLVRALKDKRQSYQEDRQNVKQDRYQFGAAPFISPVNNDFYKTRPFSSFYEDYPNRDQKHYLSSTMDGFKDANLRYPSSNYNQPLVQSTRKQQYVREPNLFSNSYLPAQRPYLHY